MKIAVIGSPDTFESKALEREGKLLGHQVIRLKFADVILETGPKIRFTHHNQDFKNFDVIIFRGITKHIPQAQLLAGYMYSAKKIVIDERLATQRYIESKFSSLLKFSQAGLPMPKTLQILDEKKLKILVKTLRFPLIAKKQMSSKGQGVFKIENFTQLKKIIKNLDLAKIIFQKYIPSNFDIRVLVVGEKVLGAIKRTAKKGDFRSNVFQGGKAEIYPLSAKLKNLALKAAKISGNDIAGVDIMISRNGQAYILESNRAPQFATFQKVTGINVAKEIIKFLEKKLRK